MVDGCRRHSLHHDRNFPLHRWTRDLVKRIAGEFSHNQFVTVAPSLAFHHPQISCWRALRQSETIPLGDRTVYREQTQRMVAIFRLSSTSSRCEQRVHWIPCCRPASTWLVRLGNHHAKQIPLDPFLSGTIQETWYPVHDTAVAGQSISHRTGRDCSTIQYWCCVARQRRQRRRYRGYWLCSRSQ